MKTLLRKELREQFKVALIGAVILAAILFQAFRNSTSQVEEILLNRSSGQMDMLQPLLARGLLTGVAVFCAIFGTVLGWLQIRAEKHRDLWAFLIHRPCSRAMILRNKILAGLILYAIG